MNPFQEAELLVRGDRGATYGPPVDDWYAVGRVWGAYLDRWLASEGMVTVDQDGEPCRFPDLPPFLVGWMMAGGIKGSREAHHRMDDNTVDAIGYLGGAFDC